ncbi:MAG: hypothetical protein H0U46_06380 [Actinobacteria bacterium]|nr:hypothetical protein [Actinomycetota bacterium]
MVALCLLDLALLGRPMLQYGFDWIANANGDMAYYVLSATHLLGHGLQSPVNLAGLADNQDFPSSAQGLTLAGLRAGTQVTLAGLAATTGKPPLALYMPMSLAIAMSGICATAALAMQASRRWWSASVAAALLVASPMAGYGVMQQLLPQNWGLGLAAALFAWLIRPEVHRNPGPRIADLCVISVLFVALFIVAYEVALSVFAAYGLYVGVLLARRRLSLRAVALLWAVPVVAVVVAVNTFLPLAIDYIDHFVLRFGTSEGFEGISQFGYAVVPTAIPGAIGLQSLFAGPQAPNANFFFFLAAGLLAGAFIVCVTTAARGAAPGIALVGYLAVGIMLARNGNDFGLFKIYMYSQPFLAAAVAVWLSYLRRRATLAIVCALLVVVVGMQVRTLNTYVNASLNPIDLPNASERDLLPKFRLALRRATAPVVTVTDNFALGLLEGASAEDKRVFFISRNLFALPWRERTIDVQGFRGTRKLVFGQNTDASRLLLRRSCVIVLPTGSQVALNRRLLPEGSQNLVVRPCGRINNALAFVVSSLGQPATLPEGRRKVSFWQLERDPWHVGRTFSGFGRYALLQIINPSRSVRLALDFTATPVVNERVLPPVAVVGSERARLPLMGSGSARVFSPPLRPKVIGGESYVVLDMGRRGQLPRVRRPGATGLWGKSVVLDPRLLTSYVRDVSLVDAREYSDLRPPTRIQSFPEDLTDTSLEYSGIYEDGWVDRQSYAHLACGPVGRLAIRALVPAGLEAQRLRVLVNGHLVASRGVMPGSLSLNLPLPACSGRRKVELRWARAAPVAPTDLRRAAALLQSIAVEP